MRPTTQNDEAAREPRRLTGRVARVIAVGALLAAAATACDRAATTAPAVGTLAGRVIGTDGLGVAGAQLTLSRAGETTATTTSDERGAYDFGPADAGLWTLAVTLPDGFGVKDSTSATAQVAVGNGRTSRRDLVLAVNEVFGSLIDEHAVPPCSAGDDGYYSANVRVTISAPGRETRTFGGGQDECESAASYAFARIPAGTWQVAVDLGPSLELAPGQSNPATVTVAPGRSALLDFTVLSQFLTVSVAASSGQPASGTSVVIRDDRGNYVRELDYYLYPSQPTSYTTRVGARAYTLSLTLPPGYRLADGQQNPLAVSVAPGEMKSVTFTVAQAPR